MNAIVSLRYHKVETRYTELLAALTRITETMETSNVFAEALVHYTGEIIGEFAAIHSSYIALLRGDTNNTQSDQDRICEELNAFTERYTAAFNRYTALRETPQAVNEPTPEPVKAYTDNVIPFRLRA